MTYQRVSTSQERLKQMLDYFEIKQIDLVKKTGLGSSTIANYFTGIREPKQDAIAKICFPYNINPVWFMGFDVPMFNGDDVVTKEIQSVAQNRIVNQTEELLLKAYREADDITKEMVNRILGIKKER